jgi:phage-related protein
LVPATQVFFYRDADGKSPVVEWLRFLRDEDQVGFMNCLARLELLEASGHELRRPAADFLRDGIYELRAKHKHVQYRLLYFFHGRNIAIVAHGIIKRGSGVPEADITRATNRKRQFERNPSAHTFQGEV